MTSSLEKLGARYDALLCDAWGVIHNGVALFPGAREALTQFRETRGPVVIITNAPRPSSVIPAQLDRIGLPRSAYDAVVTSGDATRAAIMARAGEPAFRIGPAMDGELFDGLDIDFRPLNEAAYIICTGLDDDRPAPEDYRDMLARAAARGVTMICANPDIVVNWGGQMLWCAGALAEVYEQLGGQVIYGGKPHRPIYDLAFAAIAKQRGGPVARGRVLAIGDGVKTDILGANRVGVDAMLIVGPGGVYREARKGEATPTLSDRLEAAGVSVVAAASALTW